MTTKPEAKPTDEKRVSLQMTKDGQRASYDVRQPSSARVLLSKIDKEQEEQWLKRAS